MRVALVIAALIGVVVVGARAQSPRDVEPFRSMVLERLDEIERAYATVYGTCRYTQTHSVSRSTKVSDRQFAKVGDKYFFVRSGRNLQDPLKAAASEEAVLAQAPTFSFWIHRTVGQTDYLLDAFTTRGPEEKDSLKARIEQENSDLFRAHSIPVMSLTKLLREPKCRITKLEDVVHDGRPQTRVHFDAELNNPLSASPNRVTGWFGLSEQNGWAVAAYHYTIKNNGAIEYIGDISYDTPNGHVIKSVRCDIKFDNTTVKETVTDHIQLTFGQPPREWFQMSTYGLPDPVGVELPNDLQPRRSNLYVWLISSAAVLVVLALICRWLIRRLGAAPSPPQSPVA